MNSAPTSSSSSSGSTPSKPAANAPSFATFQRALTAYLEKYKNSVEGAADGRFKSLFGDLTAIRKSMPGFSTCTSFVPKPLLNAQQVSGWRLAADVNAEFYSRDSNRLKRGFHANWMFATVPPVTASWQKYKTFEDWTNNDKTATYIEMSKPGSPRPQNGDVFMLGLAANHPTSKVLKAGMFEHIGFVTKVEKRTDGTEAWTVIAGGGGQPRLGREAVTESVMLVDPRTTPVKVGTPDASNSMNWANDAGVKKFLAGWVSVQQLFNDGHIWH